MATPPSALEDELKAALALTDSKESAAKMMGIICNEVLVDVEATKVKEQAITDLCELHIKHQDTAAISALLPQLRTFFATVPKAKTAKIVRTVIECLARIPGSTGVQVEVCKQQVEWAKTEKRTFLRQRIELRLATLYLETKDFKASLDLIGTLLSEVKKLDDKLLLVDIYLLESKVHHALRNPPRARASLTAARTAANAIYVPVQLQAEIDCQSGILHAEERDYKTAYSYFFESFEQYQSMSDVRAPRVLQYMLLSRVMQGHPEDVPAIISSKGGLKYTGPEVESMRAVAKAYKDRSLQEFQGVLDQYKGALVDDPIVHSHLSNLYDTLMEQNLVRLIEPFSRVEISHIASLIKLPLELMEAKLSQMILDKKIAGTLDQGSGCLEVFDAVPTDPVYPTALDTFDALNRVVDTLAVRSHKIAV